jgi:hypothetical protein
LTDPTRPSAYHRNWHHKHAVCTEWADVATFAAAVGERPEGHGLALLGGDVATCGACEGCRAAGAACNVRWVRGVRARGTAVLHEGEWVSQAEAARRRGISRQAMGERVARGTTGVGKEIDAGPIDTP